LDEFNEFRRVYSEIDSRRRTVWSMARLKFEAITSDAGMTVIMKDRDGNAMRGHHKATAETILEGVKAYAQSLFDQMGFENTRENPLQYVPGGQVWLNQARWDDLDAHEREKLARKYDASKAKIRLVS